MLYYPATGTLTKEIIKKMIKKLIAKLHKNKVLGIVPIVFMAPYLLSFLIQDINLIESPSQYPFFTYSDGNSLEEGGDDGNSAVHNFKFDNKGIQFAYTLGDSFSSPYAGFAFDFNKDGNFLNLSKYDILTIKFDSFDAKAIQPVILTYAENFTDKNKPMTHRFFTSEVDLIKNKLNYRIPLTSIKTPIWWHELNNTSETKMGPANFKKVSSFKIESGTISPIDTIQTMVISKIKFSKDRKALLLFTLLSIFIYYALYIITIQILNKIKTPVIIPYETLKIINHGNRDLNSVVELIAKSYNNSNLTISDIADKTGLTSIKISTLLQNKFNTPFKLYLNSIRVAEAKRLLKESDRQISEIAYMVGYKNPTHFNRIFKQLNQMTPKQYRMAHLS